MRTCKLAIFAPRWRPDDARSCRGRRRRPAALCLGHRGLSPGRQRSSKRGTRRLRCRRSNTPPSAACSAPSSSWRASIPGATAWRRTMARRSTYYQADRRSACRHPPVEPGREICRRGLRGPRPILPRRHSRRCGCRPIRLMPPICSATPRAISAMLTRNTARRGSILTARASRRMSGLAVNWLAMAAKKQHADAQATLGEMLWRGSDDAAAARRGVLP